MKVSEIRKEAIGTLTGKWKKVLAITLIYLVVTIGISFIVGIFEEGTIMANMLAILEIVITIPLSFGLAWTFLKLKRNENVKTFEFVKTGFSKFFRAWKITGRILLKMILPLIVLIISILLYTIIVNYSIMQAQEGETVSARWGLIAALVIYYAAIIYTMFVLLKYSLTSFIAYDKTEASASEIVNQSEKMTKKNRWKIILIQLPYILWEIVGSFLFLGEISYVGIVVYMIGNMLLFPYTQVAMVCFYEKLALQD